jgi:hypothetical protein
MKKPEHIKIIENHARELEWQAYMAQGSEASTPHFDAAAEACALAISEYLNARQDQRDAEMEAMTERGQDAAEEARGRSGKFHYDEEMPLEQAFEG